MPLVWRHYIDKYIHNKICEHFVYNDIKRVAEICIQGRKELAFLHTTFRPGQIAWQCAEGF